MNIIIVEDSDSSRFRLVSLLDGQYNYTVAAAVCNVEEAVEFMATVIPDLVVLDLGLPGLSGAQAVKAVKQASPDVEILVYTVSDDDEMVFAALKAGATGYLMKSAKPMQIIAAIEEIRAGGSPMSPSISRKVLCEFQRQPVPAVLREMISPLTARETEILEMLYRGHSTNHIADQLCISFHTVHTHIKKIYAKLQVNSRSQAIYEAVQKALFKV
jgi:DNA-binding NarL/FixJ family response regulator